MPYIGYGNGADRKYYYSGQTKTPFPFEGGFAPNSANFVKNLVFHECSIPFQVYVETFIPSFIELFLFITIPFFDDIVRDAGNALAYTGAAASRRKSHWRQKVKLPAPEGKAAAAARSGLSAVLRLTQPLETIGYTLLLYNGTERFFYNWNSALYGFQHCGKPPSEGPLQRHSGVQGLPINPGGLPLFQLIEDQNRANWPNSTQQAALPRGHYMVTLEATFTNQAINNANIGIKLSTPFAVQFDNMDSGNIIFKPAETKSIILHGHLYYPLLTGGSIQWLYYGSSVPIGVQIESTSISIFSFQPGR